MWSSNRTPLRSSYTVGRKPLRSSYTYDTPPLLGSAGLARRFLESRLTHGRLRTRKGYAEAQKQALLGRIMQRDQVNHVEGKNKCIMSIHT